MTQIPAKGTCHDTGSNPVFSVVEGAKKTADEKWSLIPSVTRKSEVKTPAVTTLVQRRQVALKSRGRVKRARGRSAFKKGGVAPRLPPEIDSVVTVSHRFRFLTAAAQTNTNITFGNLAGVCGCVGTVTNSTVVAMASSIKIRRITIWPGEVAGSNRVEVLWNPTVTGYYVKDESKINQTPGGITVTGPMVMRPPKDSVLAGYFTANALSSASTPVFNLYCPINSVIDLDLSWTLPNNLGGVAISGLTTVVLGTVYYLALDGHTNQIAPQGVPTTA